MTKWFLSRADLRKLIDSECRGIPLDAGDESLVAVIEGAKAYAGKSVGMTYHFAKMCEQYVKEGIDGSALIDQVYQLDSIMYFELEDCGGRFVDFLMKQSHRGDGDLDDDLFDILCYLG